METLYLTHEEASQLLSQYDVIVPSKRNYYIETLYSHYANTLHAEHLDVTREIITEKCGEFLGNFDAVMKQRGGYMFNMFIMSKELVNDYCSWLFPILFELEKRIPSEQYSVFHARFYGRVSELLFNVWLKQYSQFKPLKVKSIPFVYGEKINWLKKGTAFLMAKFFGKKYEKSFLIMKKQLSLDEIKEVELQILIEFRRICNELGLRYYLSGGTLLGAIRHKGFIPWDDDIDLAMPRSDFNKLIEFSRSYQNDTYKFLFFSQTGTLLPYAKFVNIKTHIDAKYAEDEMQQHLWLDIMPMDGLPEDLNEVARIYKKAEYYRKIIGLCNAKLGEGKSAVKKLAKYVLKPLALIYGKERAIANLNKLAMKYDYDSAKYVGAITWGLYGEAEKILKADIDKRYQVTFENEQFDSFSCWDSYLTALYKTICNCSS